MSALDAFITTQLFSFLIVFARIGGAVMIMPGFSDATIPMQSRLYMALTLSFILVPVLQPMIPKVIPQEPIPLALLICRELLTGVFIGLLSQVMMNAINLAGVMVSHGTSLSSAFTFNPQQAGQSTVISTIKPVMICTGMDRMKTCICGTRRATIPMPTKTLNATIRNGADSIKPMRRLWLIALASADAESPNMSISDDEKI